MFPAGALLYGSVVAGVITPATITGSIFIPLHAGGSQSLDWNGTMPEAMCSLMIIGSQSASQHWKRMEVKEGKHYMPHKYHEHFPPSLKFSMSSGFIDSMSVVFPAGECWDAISHTLWFTNSSRYVLLNVGGIPPSHSLGVGFECMSTLSLLSGIS